MTPERFAGCLLGLALGDALGAPFEGGPIERLLWRLIGRTWQGETRWTDDTQMSLDLAECLVARAAVDPEDLASRFARSYRWSRGYGPGAAKVLKRIARGADWGEANRSVYPGGSFGNGGAMRAPVVGLYYAARPDELLAAARLSACVTHVHPLGVEGAALIAAATAGALASQDPAEVLRAAVEACELEPFTQRLGLARSWLESQAAPSPKDVGGELGNGIAAVESCVTAVYIALRFLGGSFREMQAFVVACGGDVDTIGAMAGALWGAVRGIGSLPAEALSKLEQRDRIEALAVTLHQACRDQ